ncbi:MAG: hypothetical protein AAFU34_15575 [Pseudomonadota bacterium]
MFVFGQFTQRMVWAPAGDATAGDATADDATADDATAGDVTAGDVTAGDATAGAWYDEIEWTDPNLKAALVKAGYHTGSIEDALQRTLQHETELMKKLGRPAGALLNAPEEGQTAADFMKANAKVFGLPSEASGYEITAPEGMPEGMQVDDTLLDRWRSTAFDHGMTPAQVQAGLDLYAEIIKSGETNSVAAVEKANAEMSAELAKEWGPSAEEKTGLAVRAFETIAAQAGLSPAAMNIAAENLEKGVGAAASLRFMHQVALALGEDGIVVPANATNGLGSLSSMQDEHASVMQKIKDLRGRDAAKEKELQKRLGELSDAIVAAGGK